MAVKIWVPFLIVDSNVPLNESLLTEVTISSENEAKISIIPSGKFVHWENVIDFKGFNSPSK